MGTENRKDAVMTGPVTEVTPLVLIGRCVNCKRPFRVEIPAETRYAYAEQAVRAAGLEVPRCDCRARGKRCPELENGLPACGDSFCDGHGPSEVKFTRLRITYKPEAVCGPGNCWGAVSSRCTCSCRGKHHGQMWAVTRSVRW